MKINWTKLSRLLVFAVVLTSGVAWMAYGFAFETAPASPPNCPTEGPGAKLGCFPPINVSGSPQDKAGSLSIGNILYVERAIEAKNWVTVGSFSADNVVRNGSTGFLRVGGNFQFLPYNGARPAVGDVLTAADVNGFVKWAPAGSNNNSTSSISASDVYVVHSVSNASEESASRAICGSAGNSDANLPGSINQVQPIDGFECETTNASGNRCRVGTARCPLDESLWCVRAGDEFGPARCSMRAYRRYRNIATALCRAGDVALGGGFRDMQIGNAGDQDLSAPVDGSGNVITTGIPRGWKCEDTRGSRSVINCFAVCLDIK